MKYLAVLTVLLILIGCTTTTNYESKSEAGPARPADYPICVYPENVAVPRPFEIIGTMHVGDTPFTVMGGSLESVLNKLMNTAREKGADAVQLTNLKQPDFWTPNHRAYANFLRFTDTWESISLSDSELSNYFRTNAQRLDPIEGIWRATDRIQSRIAILSSTAKPGRDLIVVILNTKSPVWKYGDKKADLHRDGRPGVYRGVFYQDDYQPKKLAITQRMSETNRFTVIIEESNPLVFARE